MQRMREARRSINLLEIRALSAHQMEDVDLIYSDTEDSRSGTPEGMMLMVMMMMMMMMMMMSGFFIIASLLSLQGTDG